MKPIFEFDAEKSKRNKEKHGFDFVEAQELWDVEHVVIPAKIVDDETRYVIIGKIGNRLKMAVYTRRGRVTRLITYHAADRRLQRIYERSIYGKTESQIY
jgi:uncharacterized DUF497 family protein